MPSSAQLNFVQQQGLRNANAPSCAFEYPALILQPRVLGGLVCGVEPSIRSRRYGWRRRPPHRGPNL